MLRVQPPFAWRLELPGSKRARIEFVAATLEVHVESQARERTPAFRISLPCAVTMVGVQPKNGEQLVGLYSYQLRGGGGGGGIRNRRRRFWGGKGWLRDNWFGTR